MGLDIRTLSFALGLTFFIQAAALYVLSVVIVKVPGIRYWAWGSICLMLGFVAMFIRSYSIMEPLFIILGNCFHFVGFVLLYIGSKRFVGLKGSILYLSIFFILFLLSSTVFTLIDDQLKTRIIIYSVSIGLLLFLNGWILYRNSKVSFRKAAKFVSSLFIFLSLFLLVRSFYTIFYYNGESFFSPEVMQIATFLVSMSVGLLWTFGLIIMVTQKMNSEVAESGKLLKVLNEQKDTFFSILAHDLRGPFASMINLSEVLSEESDHLTPLQKREIATSLNKTAVSTNELLEDLLEWSGIHRGMKTFHPTEAAFGKIMSHTFSSIKMSASNKNIELVVKIPDDTVIYTDHYMFQTIFRNLIVNAIKFTSEGGTIVLQIEKDTDEDQVFSVTDNGIGMNREIIDSLFRIDVRNNRPGTRGEISSGFGLLLCKEFVEKHGGTILAESEEGKGSRFSFSLKKKKSS